MFSCFFFFIQQSYWFIYWYISLLLGRELKHIDATCHTDTHDLWKRACRSGLALGFHMISRRTPFVCLCVAFFVSANHLRIDGLCTWRQMARCGTLNRFDSQTFVYRLCVFGRQEVHAVWHTMIYLTLGISCDGKLDDKLLLQLTTMTWLLLGVCVRITHCIYQLYLMRSYKYYMKLK